jgi:nicotinate-nucleotide adenylyltransferase
VTRPLAIFGGTFDPIHLGHLRVAWEAAEALDADVRLMPASIPPHRPQPIASAAQRNAMLHAALTGQLRLGVDDRELRRAGPSYTIDTLRELRAEIGPQRPLHLLLGADAFADLPTWRDWRELFDYANFVVLTRPGHGTMWSDELRTEVDARRADPIAHLRTSASGRVAELPVTPLQISATAIRALLANGHEPRFLVPDALFSDSSLLAPYRSRD